MTPGDSTRELEDLDVGARRFHLVERIGRGSFGDVYLADLESDGGFRRRVVLKVLNADAARLRAATHQLRNEARILGLLVHRHIVAVQDLIRFEDRWAIVMDHVPGADLERVLDALEREQHEMFPVPAALEAGAAICEALHAALNTVVPDASGGGGLLSVIHRDIKPSNIQLTPDGEVKVLDFGVARFSLDGVPGAGPSWAGTERYMSPERIRCEGDAPPGDIYATAATVVELILGRPLGSTPVLGEEHRQFVEDALILVRRRIQGEPRIVDRVIALLRRALDSEPAIRPGARAMASSLETLAREVSGEPLKHFARRYIPRVDEVLGRASVPASGTLREGLTSPTLVAPEAEPEAPPVQHTANRTPMPQVAPVPMPLRSAPVRRETLPIPVPVPRTAPKRRSWVPMALQIGGLLAGGVTGIVVGPAVAVALVVYSARPEPEPPQVVEARIGPDSVIDVKDASSKSFGRTLLGTPLFPGSQTDLVAVVFNPSTAATDLVSEARIEVEDATGITVTCGPVSAVGKASAVIEMFPAGTCKIDVRWLGATVSSELLIESPRALRCQVESRVLRCR